MTELLLTLFLVLAIGGWLVRGWYLDLRGKK